MIVLLPLFLTISCQEAAVSDSSVSLEIVIPGLNDGSKSILPTAEALDIKYIQINGHLNGADPANNLTAQNFAVPGTIALSGLSVGTWTISVTGYNGDPADGGVALTEAVENTNVSISSGATTSATFHLAYLTEGKGTAQIQVTWPKENSTIAKVTSTLSKDGSALTPVDTTVFTEDDAFYSATGILNDVAVGDYDLLLVLTNTSGTTIRFPMIDTVNIFSGLISDEGPIALNATYVPIAAVPEFYNLSDDLSTSEVAMDSRYVMMKSATTSPLHEVTFHYTLDGSDPHLSGSLECGEGDNIEISGPVTVIKAFTTCNQYMDSAVVNSKEITIAKLDPDTIVLTDPDFISDIVITMDTDNVFTVSYTATGAAVESIEWYLDGSLLPDTDNDNTLDLSGWLGGNYRLLVKLINGSRVFSGTYTFTVD
jgi:hypothetical protein